MIRSIASSSRLLDTSQALARTPTLHLLRSALLYKLCSYDTLVRGVSRALTAEEGAGVLKAVLSPVVRRLVFSSFAAGEGLEDCLRLARKLHSEYGITAIVDHSSEELSGESALAESLQMKKRMLSGLRAEAARGRVGFVPLKATCLVDAGVLEELTVLLAGAADEAAALRELSATSSAELHKGVDRMNELCECAASAGVALLLDAEESHRQPAIRVIYSSLASKHNRAGKDPVIYNTYQLYLPSALSALRSDMSHAQGGGYGFAAKLVRGAYMASEVRRGGPGAVHGSKEQTDAAYDSAVVEVVSSLARGPQHAASFMIATHNTRSVEAAAAAMAAAGLAHDDRRISFAQILGMADPLSQALGLRGYRVAKLLCYGRYGQLLPWLLRRLEENHSALGATQVDRAVISGELWRRLLLLVGWPLKRP